MSDSNGSANLMARASATCFGERVRTVLAS